MKYNVKLPDFIYEVAIDLNVPNEKITIKEIVDYLVFLDVANMPSYNVTAKITKTGHYKKNSLRVH